MHWLLLIAVFIAPVSHADGFYGGLSANRFDAEILADISVEGSMWGGELGYAFNPFLAVEFRAAPPWIGMGIDARGFEIDVDGYNFGSVIIPSLPITNKVRLYGIGGVLLQKSEVTYLGINEDRSQWYSYWGGGIQYDMETTYLRLEATRTGDNSMTGFSLGLGMRF